MKFCSECGAAFEPEPVAGAGSHRRCAGCGHIHYLNPKVLVSTLVVCGERLLWMQRATPPFQGQWAFPGGYLELNETLQAGAARELREEVGIAVAPAALTPCMMATVEYRLAGLPFSEVRVGFRIDLDSDDCRRTGEASDVGFFTEAEAPWAAMAYPATAHVMRRFYEDLRHRRSGLYLLHASGGVRYTRFDIQPSLALNGLAGHL